jgi:hypothetical protein
MPSVGWKTHIKRPREDGRSNHMDRSLCGDLTGAYATVKPGADLTHLRDPDTPLCLVCESRHENEQSEDLARGRGHEWCGTGRK